MTPFAGFVAGVSLMLLTDAAACWLLPALLREVYRARSQQSDEQMRARGMLLAAAGVLGLIGAVVAL